MDDREERNEIVGQCLDQLDYLREAMKGLGCKENIIEYLEFIENYLENQIK